MRRLAFLLVLGLCGAAYAQGYKRTQVQGKSMCLAWQTREFIYTYHSVGSARTAGTSEFGAMDQAFLTWSALARGCTDFKFTKATPLADVVVGYKQGAAEGENTNVLTFREVRCDAVVPFGDACQDDNTCGNKYRCWDGSDGTIALTTTTFSFKTGTIFDADIEFNASPHKDEEGYLFTTISSPPCDPLRPQTPQCVSTDIQNTLTHELGHVVGLDHVDIESSTMAPSAPLGETSKRALDNGTGQGFCDTYPAGLPPSPCDGTAQVSHRIVAVGGGSGLAGCSTALGGLSPLLALLALRLRRRRRA